MMTVIIFLIVLAVLIFVHELGHFLVARMSGIRVDAFAIGFGPKLISKKVISAKHGETTYSINLIPFGGYVKIFGENPDADSTSGPDSARSFVNQPKYIQAAVLVAGVFFNFLFAWAIFAGLFMYGFPASTESYPQYANRITDERVVISSVAIASPAERAGIKAGDVLMGNNGVKITSTDIQNLISGSKGNGVALSYKRGDVALTATVTPATGLVEGKYAIGIEMSEAGTLKLPVHIAVWEGGRYVFFVIKETVVGLFSLIETAIRGKASFSAVTGPIGIASYVGDAARLGFVHLLAFTALISINLGVINLVPFPALDGGRLLFVVIEAIIRRRIKTTVANTINTIGFGLLMLLMIIVTYHDIAIRWFVK